MLHTLNITDWYMKILNPLSSEVKLNLINRLSESVLKERLSAHKSKKKSADSVFFESLSDSWDDGTTPEEEMQYIRESRQSNITREIDPL